MSKIVEKVKSRDFLLQLMQIDLFATTPSLNYRKASHYTFCGFLLTLVIIGFLGYTFIIQIYGAFTAYLFRSVTYFDPDFLITIEPIHTVCLEPQGGVFPAGDASKFIYAELHPNKTPMPIQAVEQTSQQLCVSLVEPLELPKSQLLSFVIKESEFTSIGTTSLGVTFKYPLLAVVDSQSYPVGYYPMAVKEKYDLTATTQNAYLTLNKAYYWIDRGFLWSTPHEHTALEFDKSSTTPNPRTFVTEGTDRRFGVHLGFGGQVTKNFLTSSTLGEILSSVGGLMSSLMVIIGFVFTSFFQFKYYENLLKGMRIRGYLSNYSSPDAANDGSSLLKSSESKRMDDSEIGAINLKSATQSKSEAVVQDIQISLWGFLLYKSIIGKLLVRICPKRLVNTKQKAQVEALEAWEEQFSSKLDVMELLGKYLKTNNDSNKMTVVDIESSPIKRVGSDMDSSPIKPSGRPTRTISPVEVEGKPAQVSNKP